MRQQPYVTRRGDRSVSKLDLEGKVDLLKPGPMEWKGSGLWGGCKGHTERQKGAEGTSHILTVHHVYNRLFNLLTTFLCY